MSGGARSAMLYERSSTASLRPRGLLGADVLPQGVDGLLDVLVVELLRDGAGAVVTQELLEPDARVGLGGVRDLPPLRDAAAVDVDDELDRDVVVVADLLERAHDQLPVDRSLPARH